MWLKAVPAFCWQVQPHGPSVLSNPGVAAVVERYMGINSQTLGSLDFSQRFPSNHGCLFGHLAFHRVDAKPSGDR